MRINIFGKPDTSLQQAAILQNSMFYFIKYFPKISFKFDRKKSVFVMRDSKE